MPTVNDWLAIPDPPTLWLVDPYVSRESITFIHGRTSIGKSPVTWEMARCVSTGIPFLGRPVTQGKVLYVEADSPGIIVKPRLRALPEPLGDWWIEPINSLGYDLGAPGPACKGWLKAIQERLEPDLVIWNTLRSLTRMDLSKGETVVSFYQNLRMAFPQAAHVLVHHNRKESTQPNAPKIREQSFSGSGSWLDIANIGLHLRRRADPSGKKYLSLEHTKTQASGQAPPFRFTLAEDGTGLLTNARLARLRELISGPVSPGLSSDSDVRLQTEFLMNELSISRATLFRELKRLKLESH